MTSVCVLDMDETLGVFHKNVFHLRPKLNVLIHLLRLLRVDIVLWSLGEDDYVRRVVNGFLPDIASHAYKIFARREATMAKNKYRYPKASEHIRIMYEEPIFLMAVDDHVSQNMDAHYDVRIHVKPYQAPNPSDRTLLKVCEQIIECMANVNLQALEETTRPSDGEAYREDAWTL